MQDHTLFLGVVTDEWTDEWRGIERTELEVENRRDRKLKAKESMVLYSIVTETSGEAESSRSKSSSSLLSLIFFCEVDERIPDVVCSRAENVSSLE